MRVLTFTSLFPNNVSSNLGGFIARRMTTWASAYGTNWTVVAPVPFFPPLPLASPWKKYSDVKDVEKYREWDVHHFRYAMVPQFGLPFQGHSMAFCTTRQVVRLSRLQGPFDILDAHFIYPDAFAAMKISRKLKIPLVVSARGSDINLYAQIASILPMIRNVLRSADAVIGVSEDLVEKMIRLGAPEKRCYHIPNGVDTHRFHPKGDNSRPKKDRLLAVGNIVPEKGFDNLLKAVAVLKSLHPEIELNIIGSGPHSDHLVSLCKSLEIESLVSFVGQVPHNEINAWFQKSGVFCLSSLREGNPNVVLEALASGLPVASTPAGGVPELIIENVNGAIASDFSVESLVAAIRKVLSREWSSEKIRGTISDRTWDKVAKEVNTVFQNLC
ncbi:MAG TPA: hypothetical protein DCR95_12935 [Desulfobacter sp.]|uniref:glycosyltransferase n=1 Tax=Desulfobacter sp. UBA2225 TaxID=1961413 RepID=UPI000E8D1E9D|nr:glycosyltransferase [Desulfobacter sp. UBA2225]HAR34949.1 hypothetical protein [Desulfobacter sp.]